MKVSELMTKNVKSCESADSLQNAAQVMWENDFGFVPIVDASQHVTGILTDRDICMAAYTQGKALARIPVSSVSTKTIFSARETDSIDVAETLMRQKQVRRVPVLDADGRLSGVLSLNDLARHHHHSSGSKSSGLSSDGITKTLAAISQPRPARALPAGTAAAKA